MRVKTVTLLLTFFVILYPLAAQENSFAEMYVDPDEGVSVGHPVGASSASINYFYEIVNSAGRPVVPYRDIKTRPRGGDGQSTEERFITHENALDILYRPYILDIRWDCKYFDGSAYPGGDYFLRFYAVSGKNAQGRARPFYEYKIILDAERDPFVIELAVEEVSPNAGGVLFARMVDPDSREPVLANRWEAVVYNNADGEPVLKETQTAPTKNDVIPFQYCWYDFSGIDGPGEYRIEITNRDRAGHYFSDSKTFSIVYTTDSTDMAARYEGELAALQAAESSHAEETAVPRSSPQEAQEKPMRYDIFSMIAELWSGSVEIQGRFNEEDRTFSFSFVYEDVPEDNPVSNIAIAVYNEKAVKITDLQDSGINQASWNGVDSAGNFILTSNTAYRFDFTFTGTDETITAANSLTTGLVTEDAGNGELLVVLPGLYFPGFGSDIYTGGSFLDDNMGVIWKTADLLNRYRDRYEYAILRGYANYTTYPKNGVLGPAVRARMDAERPVLLAFSRRRAESVRNFLLLFKVPEDKIRIEAAGPDRPLADPNGPENYKNRRVEIYLKERR